VTPDVPGTRRGPPSERLTARKHEAARAVAKEPDGSHPFWLERKIWLSMFEAFRHSVEYRRAVVYG
jgi:hypothetical protein